MEIQFPVIENNKGVQAVSIAGWSLDKGVSYFFSGGATIPAGGYLVVSGDPTAVMARYGFTVVHGPWTGRLSGSAEKVELKDSLGESGRHRSLCRRWALATIHRC